jgi:hypothetical protein
MLFETVNQEYEDRVSTALFDAILQTSLDKESNTAALLTGEIITACLRTIALLAATSEVTGSPTKTRDFAEHCAKRLRKMIAASKDIHASGGLDFITVVEAAKRH